MTQVSLEQAYSEACAIIGDQQVKIRLLEQTLAKAQVELKEAGERIVALTSGGETQEAKHTHRK